MQTAAVEAGQSREERRQALESQEGMVARDGGAIRVAAAAYWSESADAQTALVLHGYVRRDYSLMADADEVTWRDAVRLRSVSKHFRTIVPSRPRALPPGLPRCVAPVCPDLP